ncbi:MAG: alanine racemase [Candidatus Hydrogenedentes bacterium]|nr:alanine racemase [Candidatus Hydrogenedentota bacterium]
MSIPSPSRAIVDLGAYARNLAYVRTLIPKECALMPIVKADAYGLGAVPIAKKAIECGAAMLGVASVSEAVELREAGIMHRILVMVQPSDDALPAAVEYELRLMISETSCAERVGELARRANRVVPIHCKIDTGMGRQGLNADTAVSQMLYLTRVSHVDLEGVATHFPIADSARDPFTANQLRTFRHVLRQLEKEGIPYEMVHAANSAAIVNHPASVFDMVRPGLMTYGVWPTDTPPATSPLSQVLRWESEVVLVKDLEKGVTIGYGRTYTADEKMRIALVPVGYADGFRYSLSNRGHVLIRGKRCPVRGSVSMDQIVVDVTQVAGVTLGDPVTIIGRDGSLTITVEDVAKQAETIPYEILTGIGRRVQRVYVDTPHA